MTAHVWCATVAGVLRLIAYGGLHLRQELGRDVVRALGPALLLDPSAIASDVAGFGAALEDWELRTAVALARAAVLDGFHLSSAPAFQRWAEEEREQTQLTIPVERR